MNPNVKKNGRDNDTTRSVLYVHLLQRINIPVVGSHRPVNKIKTTTGAERRYEELRSIIST